MAIGSITPSATAIAQITEKLKKNGFQFFLATLLVIMCGATKKFFTFPMPWIAGQAKCVKVVTEAPNNFQPFSNDGYVYQPHEWIRTEPDCEEKAKVFTFVDEQFTATTAYLVFFGVAKACFNFLTGVIADRIGRKWALTLGWFIAIPMPFMVLYAENWWTVAVSNLFLGMQQALVWSTTIFIMIDYLGQQNSGAAIGFNETVGYTTIAIVNKIVGAILDEDEPRGAAYWVVLGLIVGGILISATVLKESRLVAEDEDAKRTDRTVEAVRSNTTTELLWPSGRGTQVDVSRSAFIYASFINVSLMSICFAGLMINFLSGFAWGLFVKWMKDGHEGKWDALDKTTVSDVVLCYGIFKGVCQVFFGFLGDRIGRKYLIVAGLSTCVVALCMLVGVGVDNKSPADGFFAGASFLGLGTAMMYTNNLAAVCDHSDPSWRSSALGAYRFWRDMGYAVGALTTAAVADSIGIPWSVGVAAIATAVAAAGVALLYTEVQGDTLSDGSSSDGGSAEKAVEMEAVARKEKELGGSPLPHAPAAGYYQQYPASANVGFMQPQGVPPSAMQPPPMAPGFPHYPQYAQAQFQPAYLQPQWGQA